MQLLMQNLISSLREKGIKDESVLRAMSLVPRERFIPESLHFRAFEDNALPIDCNQTISQPYTVAYMTELLSIEKFHKVLEIGTGSGYQCAILSILSDNVYTVERIEHLHKSSKFLLKELNIKAQFKLSDGSLGWEEEAPFDRIIVTAAAPSIPTILIQQLNIGGILIVPVGDLESQEMFKIIKQSNKDIEIEKFNKFRFVPLIGSAGWNEK